MRAKHKIAVKLLKNIILIRINNLEVLSRNPRRMAAYQSAIMAYILLCPYSPISLSYFFFQFFFMFYILFAFTDYRETTKDTM